MASVSDRVMDVIMPLLARESLELVDVEYKKEGAAWYLRVFIDKPGGVQLGDCEKASLLIGSELDKHDIIPHRYYLEVSSPGVERPLKKPEDFLRFRGSEIVVRTTAKFEGSKNFQGKIVDYDEDDRVVIETADGLLKIPHSLISKARLKVF